MPWFAVKEDGVEVRRIYAEDVDSLRMNVTPDQAVELIASAPSLLIGAEPSADVNEEARSAR